MAIEESADDVRPWVEDVTLPVLLDREHVLTDRYAISNVPTVVWIDEDGRVARPNTVAFGTDTFVDFTGVAAQPHLDAIRRWVREGEVPVVDAELADCVGDLTEDEIEARLWFRIAAHLRRTGREEAAGERFERAGSLAPLDFTIRRAAMPLTGDDPFGASFFTLYGEWQEAGSPYHGLGPEAD